MSAEDEGEYTHTQRNQNLKKYSLGSVTAQSSHKLGRGESKLDSRNMWCCSNHNSHGPGASVSAAMLGGSRCLNPPGQRVSGK